jgi:hypothetical protein
LTRGDIILAVFLCAMVALSAWIFWVPAGKRPPRCIREECTMVTEVTAVHDGQTVRPDLQHVRRCMCIEYEKPVAPAGAP